MAVAELSLLDAKVMHKRFAPAVNQFAYGVYYLVLPLSRLDALDECGVARNRFARHSFYDRDHGARDGGNLDRWARDLLQTHKIDGADGEIVLITFPRIWGYVFNPVSFWLCHDRAGNLRAVLYEVNNTFGETHTYLCAHPDHRAIAPEDVIVGQKLFHVSPFLEREGSYRFRITLSETSFGVWIDWMNGADALQLATAVTGEIAPLTPGAVKGLSRRYPLVTLKAIALIHWQAVKLLWKRVRYIVKPRPFDVKVSVTDTK